MWRRAAVVAIAAATATIGSAGIAVAVSGGNYAPAQQDCPKTADANNDQGTVAGCKNAVFAVEDGNGTRYVEVGSAQLPQGSSTPGLFGVGSPGSDNFPHQACAGANTAGLGQPTDHDCATDAQGAGATAGVDTNDPSQSYVVPATGSQVVLPVDGLVLYFGADDNLDAGEHDGVDGSAGTKHAANGPSDGGAISAHLTPSALTRVPTAQYPIPWLGISTGACADGVCLDVTTERHTLYQGGSRRTRDAANYDGKDWDPYSCSSGSHQDEESCRTDGGKSLDGYRREEAGNVVAEPGVQFYEDPDPQSSPIDPFYEGGASPQPTLYPLPALYVGTCGVIAGGGATFTAPAGTPMTNHSGQVVVPGAC